MGYSIVDFAKSLRVDRCKIRNTPNLIFLCGGKTVETGAYQSARDYFYRHLKRKAAGIYQRVNLAEDVNAWFRRSEFPDLLELENYLADLADITVLFVESPGSIAELGAFAASDVLRPKTLAVLNNFLGSDRSFISEGPVQKIKNDNPDLVHYYDWDPGQLNKGATTKEFGEMAEGLTEFLIDRDRSHPREQSFDPGKHGHTLLLVADLIRIAGVATSTDIGSCLREIGCKFDQVQMGRYFSLLESMSFIKRVLRSNQTFYVTSSSKSFIRYAYQPGASLRDQKRIKAAIRSSLDKLRRKIFAKSLLKLPKKGTSRV
jgi:hypothetical protein